MVTQNEMDIQLLDQKLDWLTKELKDHMEYEEKQRDKIDEKLTALDQKLNKVLIYGSVILTVVNGGAQMLPL